MQRRKAQVQEVGDHAAENQKHPPAGEYTTILDQGGKKGLLTFFP